MRILAVDDEQVSRLVLQGLVESLGHECLIAEDGDEAWQLIGDTSPDVVITDWMMPGTDGMELCRRIRARTDGSYIYVIVATSLTERDNVLRGMEAGADDYLTKPLNQFDLETRLVAAKRVTTLLAELARYRAELARLARTDPLTQLRNRLSLGDDLAELHARARRYGRSYCLAMCDVDRFKAYNDTFGHQAGDKMLREVGDTLGTAIRQGDLLYRYGGEDFLMVLPEQTAHLAARAAERARAALESLGVAHGGAAPGDVVTISVGLAAFDPDGNMTSDDVLRHADTALYEAKAAGRNRVVLAGVQPSR